MRILLVHQDTRVLLALSQALRGGNVTVAIASNAAMATERAGIGEYDAVLVSRMLAEATHDGLGVIDALALELKLKEEDDRVPFSTDDIPNRNKELVG